MTIAQTILQQLGGNKFVAMTGARLFVDTGNGLKFRIPASGPNRINIIMITLDNDDTYTVTFGTVFRSGFKTHKIVSMVYADNLQRIFTDNTGLDTHL